MLCQNTTTNLIAQTDNHFHISIYSKIPLAPAPAVPYIDGWMDAINVGNFRRRILATSGPDKVHHNRIMKPPWMSRMLPLVRGWFSPNIGGFWAHFRVVYLIHDRSKGRHIHGDYDVVVACHPRATF